MSAHSRPRRQARRFAWLGVLSLAAAALFLPSGNVLALTGAVYTSNADGSIINANIYAAKADVYLTGGPCNGGSHLAAGDYYFQVSSPNGVLLSSDSIGDRFFTVANDFIQSTASHVVHAVNCSPAVTGITVQLLPYDDTPNSGGEYKLTIATADTVEACAGFDDASTTFEICGQADSKSDNFKVGVIATPTPTPVPTPTGGVGGATTPPTATPAPTLPSTSTIDSTGSGSTGEGWRVILLAMAGVLAASLLLTPAGAVVRKDDASR